MVLKLEETNKHIRTSEPFNEQCGYGGFCELTGDKDIDRRNIAEMFARMWDYIPPEYMSGIGLIFHPTGASGTGEIEYKATFAWKYTFKKWKEITFSGRWR